MQVFLYAIFSIFFVPMGHIALNKPNFLFSTRAYNILTHARAAAMRAPAMRALYITSHNPSCARFACTRPPALLNIDVKIFLRAYKPTGRP